MSIVSDHLGGEGRVGFQRCESVDRAAAPPSGGSAKPAFTGARARSGRRRFTLVLTLAKPARVVATVSRKGARKPLGRVRFKARTGRVSKTIRKVAGKRLRKGTYKVVVTVGATSRTLTVKVR